MQHILTSDKNIILHLNRLWHGIYIDKTNFINKIINYIANLYYHFTSNYTTNIKNNLNELRNLGFIFYSGNHINNEQPIDNIIKITDLNNVIKFLKGNDLKRTDIMKKICYCTIFHKYKSGDVSNPENFRYLINHHNTIKILDRIWYKSILYYCNVNLPDINIFKLPLSLNSLPIIITANNNTLSIDNVILLDLHNAFDSLEWNIIEELLYNSLKRKIDIFYAIEFVRQYMIILTKRVIRFKENIIRVTKSLPTGLPSSALIFTFIIEEIIIQWLTDTKFKINEDLILNIYIDDFYIKILNLSKKDLILSTLIKYLTKYKLIINYKKSKVNKNLYSNNSIYNQFQELSNNDLYLGIPFTRDIILYKNIILQELYKKHQLSYTWQEIYDIIISLNHDKKKLLIGYLNYKLKPLINFDNLTDFIKNHLI